MPLPLAESTLEHLRDAGERLPVALPWASRSYRRRLAHYYNLIVPPHASVLEIGCGSGDLLAHLHARRRVGVDPSPARVETARRNVPSATFHVQAGETLDLDERFDYLVLADTLNAAADVQVLLERLHAVSHADTRLVVNYASALWRPLLTTMRAMGLASPQQAQSWLGRADVRNLLELADWRQVTEQPRLLLPIDVPIVEPILNRAVAPLAGAFCLTVFSVSRSLRVRDDVGARRVSVVVPARNEAGNIDALVTRIPEMGAGTEIVIVEGQSTDDTWARVEQAAAAHPERIRALRQPGTGKGDAVRAGFAAATGDVLMILDADLAVPPEELPKFYDVIASGKAELANGVRLVYPVNGRAMPWLNLLVNRVFGLLFTWLIGQPVKDTLCGTKVLTRRRYDDIARGRAYFGDIDPFGDFDLLFGASRLGMAIADVPIRYQERTYGQTNIRRWRHGWLLLRMVVFAARKLKFV